MMNYIMFIICVVVWGSSYWFAKMQASYAPASFSLMLRLIVALLFFVVLYIMNKKHDKLKILQYFNIGIFALCNFMLGYFFLYLSANILTSGLVVVIFSFKSILTPIMLAIFNKEKIKKQFIYGAIIAIIGIIFLVYDTISYDQKSTLIGIIYAILGTFITSIGDLYSAKNNKDKIQPIYANLMGLIFVLPIIIIINIQNMSYLQQLNHPSYLLSILYLGIFASGIAWVFYLKLVHNIGAIYSSYMVTLFPIVGCIISILLEHMIVTNNIIIGLILEVFGLAITFLKIPTTKT